MRRITFAILVSIFSIALNGCIFVPDHHHDHDDHYDHDHDHWDHDH